MSVTPDMILQQKILKAAASSSYSGKSTKAFVQEVFALLQILQARNDDLLHFASEPPNVVNVKNCELWLQDDGGIDVRPHNHATGMRHVLNVTYDPGATCEQYDATIEQIFENAKFPQTLVRFFNELLGYAIQLKRDITIILMMIGDGSNGKTSLVKVLIALLGASFVHSGRIDDLEEGRFGIGNLFGKHLFVDDDVRAGARLPDGVLKK